VEICNNCRPELRGLCKILIRREEVVSLPEEDKDKLRERVLEAEGLYLIK
jgi:hypothetical protein